MSERILGPATPKTFVSSFAKFFPLAGEPFFVKKCHARRQVKRLLWALVGKNEYRQLAVADWQTARAETKPVIKSSYIPEDLPPIEIPGVIFEAPAKRLEWERIQRTIELLPSLGQMR